MTLVQIDGVVDTVQSYTLDLPEGLELSDLEFIQSSSNEDVLKVEDNRNMLVTHSTAGAESVNCTVSHSFDAFAGSTVYKLTVIVASTKREIYSAVIQYTICGMSFYYVSIDGHKVLVSGEERSMSLSYKEAMIQPPLEEKEIRVFVQYPDGTTSEDQDSGLFAQSGSCKLQPTKHRAQFQYDSVKCDSLVLGSYSEIHGISFPSKCGYGFYRNSRSELCFGIFYEEYRTGAIVFEIEWHALVASYGELAEEGYMTILKIVITGDPPVVVTDIVPRRKLYRPEGGQVVKLYYYNFDLQSSNQRQIGVEKQAEPWSEVSLSYMDSGAPEYMQESSFLSGPGNGTDLDWVLQYITWGDILNAEIKKAVTTSTWTYKFSFDSRPIEITSVDPTYVVETGNEIVNVYGYFEGFDLDYDGIYFNGQRLPKEYIQTVSSDHLVFMSPPKEVLGSAYEYTMWVQVGFARSNEFQFYFSIRKISVHITQSGTSGNDDGNLFIGDDCTPIRMTAMTHPFTNQVLSYKWELHAMSQDGSAEGPELLHGLKDPDVLMNAQTIEIQPHHLQNGKYVLSVEALLKQTVARHTIIVSRESGMKIGAFLLDPPPRSIAHPASPLRLSAVVRPPKNCYNGTEGLIVQWKAFGRVKEFRASNITTTISGADELETTPARLGWELLVPQAELSYGFHDVEFTAWYEADPTIRGTAYTEVQIYPASLRAVIRNGESRIVMNSNTGLRVFGTNSFDPDYLATLGTTGATGETTPISYKWKCLETSDISSLSENFNGTTCADGFLPSGPTASEFQIPHDLFASLGEEIVAIQYELVVSKGEDRSSMPSFLTIQLDKLARTHPSFEAFQVTVEDIKGQRQDHMSVQYYEPIVLNVKATDEDVSWSYHLVDPPLFTFLSQGNLIQNPLYYSPDASSIGGNRKPLGIEAMKLNPHTSYTIRISFTGSVNFETTDVFFTFKTMPAPALLFPEPTVMNGTTATQFTVTAGVPQDTHLFSYYFFVEDEEGREFCVGGCTGYDVAYFYIGRPGEYKLSVKLLDSQGKAELGHMTQERRIYVSEAPGDRDMVSEMETLFVNGDDNTWTQLAFDYAIQCPHETFSEDSDFLDSDNSTRQAVSRHRTSSASGPRWLSRALSPADARAKTVDQLRTLFCNSITTPGHGANGVQVSIALAECQLTSPADTSVDQMYEMMKTLSCITENRPAGIVLPEDEGVTTLINLIESLGDLVAASKSASRRRRLLQEVDVEAEVAKVLKTDIVLWGSGQIVLSSTSGKGDGVKIEPTDKICIVSAKHKLQLTAVAADGRLRPGLECSSVKVWFKDGAIERIFASEGEDTRRYLLVREVRTEFLVEDKFQVDYIAEPLGRSFMLRVYEASLNGAITEVVPPESSQDLDPGLCMQLPLDNVQPLESDIEARAAMTCTTDDYRFGDPKPVIGTKFKMVQDGSTLSFTPTATEHSIADLPYVSACTYQVSTICHGALRTKLASSAIGLGPASLFGKQGMGLLGVVMAGLIFVVVAVVAAWVVATRTMAAGAAPAVALEAHELYVERDIYGRGTIFDAKRT